MSEKTMIERVATLEEKAKGLEAQMGAVFKKIDALAADINGLRDRLWRWTIVVSIMAGASGGGTALAIKFLGG